MNITCEILFIDDGSTDNSLEQIMALSIHDRNVSFIELSRNFGQQVAISAGIDFVKGNRTVIIDADLQDPPELIPDLYNKMNDGFNVVYARRIKRKGESLMKKTSARLFYRIMKRITAVDIPVDTGDFRIIDKKVVNALRNMSEQAKFIRGQISWTGYKQTYVEYVREYRFKGKTSYSYIRMFRFAKDGITSFSDLPLKIFSYGGFLVALISFIVMIYALYSKYVLGSAVPGWTSIIFSVLFLGGIQLVGIGIIGEYISRIAANVRKRPLYFINRNNIIDEPKNNPEEH